MKKQNRGSVIALTEAVVYGLLLVIIVSLGACSRKKVYFVNLESGAEVKSPFRVEMRVQGMKVVPAGEIRDNEGHYHILINQNTYSQGEVIPTDEKHLHFGGGQTHTELELSPGTYTLTLQFADGVHRSYGQELSTSIQVTVQE